MRLKRRFNSLSAGSVASQGGPCGDRRQGFTLLEVTIVLAVLGVIFGGAMTVVLRSTISFDEQIRELAIDQFGWRTMDRLAEELRAADPTSILPAVIADSDMIQFQRITGYDTVSASKLLAPLTTIKFQLETGETANGQDDNGDGRADEGYLVYTQSGNSYRLAGNILGVRFNTTAAGLSFAVDVGLADRDGIVQQRTFVQEISIRN